MRPHVILHNQVSLDGRMDHLPIDPGLFYEIAMGFGEDATLAGTDTLLHALELFGDAEPGEAPADAPLLVVPDSRGRIRRWKTLLDAPYWRGGVSLCTTTTPPVHTAYLEGAEVPCHVVGEERVDLAAALELLATEYGVSTLRVDSGGTLNGALLRAGLVDEVSVLVSPYLTGGSSPNSIFRAPDLTGPDGVVGLELVSVEQPRDAIVWLKYRVTSA